MTVPELLIETPVPDMDQVTSSSAVAVPRSVIPSMILEYIFDTSIVGNVPS